jgi:hypothetical protein
VLFCYLLLHVDVSARELLASVTRRAFVRHSPVRRKKNRAAGEFGLGTVLLPYKIPTFIVVPSPEGLAGWSENSYCDDPVFNPSATH